MNANFCYQNCIFWTTKASHNGVKHFLARCLLITLVFVFYWGADWISECTLILQLGSNICWFIACYLKSYVQNIILKKYFLPKMTPKGELLCMLSISSRLSSSNALQMISIYLYIYLHLFSRYCLSVTYVFLHLQTLLGICWWSTGDPLGHS